MIKLVRPVILIEIFFPVGAASGRTLSIVSSAKAIQKQRSKKRYKLETQYHAPSDLRSHSTSLVGHLQQQNFGTSGKG